VKLLLKQNLLVLIFNVSLLNANTIAVVSDSQKSDLSNKFGKDIIAILDSQKRYEIVEQEKIEDIYKELQKGQSGLVSQEESAKLGYLKGIHYFIYYNINKQENNNYVGNFRIVKTETGTVIGAGRSKGDYENVLNDLSQQIIQQLDIYLNLNNPQSPYTILLKLNKEKPQYRVGETLQIKFKVIAHKNAPSKKVYIQLFSIDATGKITMIYPNKYSGFEPIEIDKEYIFPSPKDDFEWELTPPTGTEYIQAFVSERPIDIFQTWNNAKEELFPESKQNGNLLITYRGIQTKLKKEKIENWSAMRVAYELFE